MSSVIVSVRCEHQGCDVALSGSCAKGNDPIESCPYFRDEAAFEEDVADDDATDGDTQDEVAPELPDVHSIRPAIAMRFEGLVRFRREVAPRTIVVVGAHDAGKSTLAATLFEMFRDGPISGFEFAGSRTMHALSERTHLRSIGSRTKMPAGPLVPRTPRTSRNDPVDFVHLAMRRSAGQLRHLVVSDRSGEVYEDARLETSIIETLEEFLLADRVAFVVDGSKLASEDHRGHSRQFTEMVRALHDNGALARCDGVEVLITKLDMIEASESREAELKGIAEFETDIVNHFGGRGLNLLCHRVCALPACKPEMGWEGIVQTLERWMSDTRKTTPAEPTAKSASRQIDRLEAKGW